MSIYYFFIFISVLECSNIYAMRLWRALDFDIEHNTFCKVPESIEAGADINQIVFHRRALHHAVRFARGDIVEYLINHGADTSLKDLFGYAPYDAYCLSFFDKESLLYGKIYSWMRLLISPHVTMHEETCTRFKKFPIKNARILAHFLVCGIAPAEMNIVDNGRTRKVLKRYAQHSNLWERQSKDKISSLANSFVVKTHRYRLRMALPRPLVRYIMHFIAPTAPCNFSEQEYQDQVTYLLCGDKREGCCSVM